MAKGDNKGMTEVLKIKCRTKKLMMAHMLLFVPFPHNTKEMYLPAVLG